MTTKIEVVKFYKQQLSTNERWAIQGLKRIAMRQTSYELESEATRDENGVGFSGPDAEILTSFYKRVEKGWPLTEKQMKILFRLMPRYAGQLLSISISEGKVRKIEGEYRFN